MKCWMIMNYIEYKYNTLKDIDIEANLFDWADNFKPNLTEYVFNLKEYAEKIYKNALTIEAYRGKKLVGWIAIYLNHENAFITHFVVTKDFQHSGIGTKLLDLAKNEAKRNKSIELECFKINSNALKFYIKNGFKIIDETTNKYKLVFLR